MNYATWSGSRWNLEAVIPPTNCPGLAHCSGAGEAVDAFGVIAGRPQQLPRALEVRPQVREHRRRQQRLEVVARHPERHRSSRRHAREVHHRGVVHPVPAEVLRIVLFTHERKRRRQGLEVALDGAARDLVALAPQVALECGPEDHDHDDGSTHRHEERIPVDLIVEMNAQFNGDNRIAGAVEQETHERVLLLSPGIRIGLGERGFVFGSVGVPVWQDVGLREVETDVRASLGAGLSFGR